MKTPRCPKAACRKLAPVVRHGFYRTRSGRRRRYRCRSCGKTFSLTNGTPYFRLQHRRSTIDEVAALSVEGVSKSAIARVKRLAWNTVDRWLEKAAECCRRFNDLKTRKLSLSELQVDEIRTFVGGKRSSSWIFTTIDVASRLWPVALVGRRSYRNTRSVLRDLRDRTNRSFAPLIVTDGFEYYARVVQEVFGATYLYGQVLKTRRNDRIVKIERRHVMGGVCRIEEALGESEDSTTLNTSFVERLNLTIRQGSAYLARRSLSHARSTARLDDHLELLRCHYNFVRPHRALKFGSEMRTPAMQAGLTSRRLTFREVFSLTGVLLTLENFARVFVDDMIAGDIAATRMRLAA